MASTPLASIGVSSNRHAVVVFSSTLAGRQFVVRTLAGDWEPTWTANARETVKRLRATGASALIVVPTRGVEMLFDALVSEIVRVAPLLTVVVVTPSSSDASAGPLLATHEQITEGHSRSAERLRDVLMRADFAYRQARVGDRVSGAFPYAIQHIVRHAIICGGRSLSVPTFAGSVGLSDDALRARVAKYADTTLQELLLGGRLMAAATLLQSTMRTVERIANELGFASPQGLANQVRAYAGVTPTELRSWPDKESNPLVQRFVDSIR